jgi:hypothetical protein
VSQSRVDRTKLAALDTTVRQRAHLASPLGVFKRSRECRTLCLPDDKAARGSQDEGAAGGDATIRRSRHGPLRELRKSARPRESDPLTRLSISSTVVL